MDRPAPPSATRCYPEPARCCLELPGAALYAPQPPLASHLQPYAPGDPRNTHKIVNNLVIKAAQASRSGPMRPRYLPLPARAVPVSAAGSGDDY
jgi:hypothetical protein